jgi:ubiquinone/menaquinone biosynthesis C-methylase UbiE
MAIEVIEDVMRIIYELEYKSARLHRRVKAASPEEQEPERPSATGAGTGNDTARLAHEGYAVTAIDLSTEAIEQAQAKFGATVTFLVADMALPLPFPHASFDAVMSNVALHMCSDSVTPDRSSTRSGDWCGPDACFSFTSTRSKTVLCAHVGRQL